MGGQISCGRIVTVGKLYGTLGKRSMDLGGNDNLCSGIVMEER